MTNKPLKTTICVILATIGVLSLALFTSCGGKGNGKKPSGGGETPVPPTETFEFTDHVYDIYTADATARGFVSLATEQEQFEYMQTYGNTNHDAQAKVTLNVDRGVAPYTVKIADNTDLKNAYELQFPDRSISVGGAFAPSATYYYEVTDATGARAQLGTIKTAADPLRVITVGGARNVRDLGGWKTVDGYTVRYGMLYRGAKLNDINDGGKQTLSRELKVKTELDLRQSSETEGQTGCAFDGEYKLINITQYDLALNDANSRSGFKKIIELLADESNYPVYFHCRAGADRTGTLAYLINGLLGVSYEDLTKDFELTSFGGQGLRLRSDIVTDENGKPTGYGETGVYYSITGKNHIAWGKMHADMLAKYPEEKTLSAVIEKYLINECGVAAETLDKLRVLLLGLQPDSSLPQAKEATCDEDGVLAYKYGDRVITVPVASKGHKIVIEGEGENAAARCENCDKLNAAEYKYYADKADVASGFNFPAIDGTPETVKDVYGKPAVMLGKTVKLDKSDVGDEPKYLIVEYDDGTLAVVGFKVWTKIVKKEADLKEINANATVDSVKNTVKAHVLIANDVTLTYVWTKGFTIGSGMSGYAFEGVIEGNGHTISGFKTESGGALVNRLGRDGVIRNLTLAGEAVKSGAQFLVANTDGGLIENVTVRCKLGEQKQAEANSALLGNIGGDKSDVITLKNVVVIEPSAKIISVRRDRSSALGRAVTDISGKIVTDGLIVVGVKPLLVGADGHAYQNFATLSAYLGEKNLVGAEYYDTVDAYEAIN